MRNEHGSSRIGNFNAMGMRYEAISSTKVLNIKNLLKVIQGKNMNSN